MDGREAYLFVLDESGNASWEAASEFVDHEAIADSMGSRGKEYAIRGTVSEGFSGYELELVPYATSPEMIDEGVESYPGFSREQKSYLKELLQSVAFSKVFAEVSVENIFDGGADEFKELHLEDDPWKNSSASAKQAQMPDEDIPDPLRGFFTADTSNSPVYEFTEGDRVRVTANDLMGGLFDVGRTGQIVSESSGYAEILFDDEGGGPSSGSVGKFPPDSLEPYHADLEEMWER